MLILKNSPKVAIILAFSYVILFVLDKTIFEGKLFSWGRGKSFDNMEKNEWYRLFTGAFFHFNILHLLSNTFAIYFVGVILENKIGSFYFLLIYSMGNIAEGLVWGKFTSTTECCGASPGIYSLIACILILHLHNPDLLNLSLGTWSLNYILCFFFLSNFIELGVLVSHSLGFSFGIVVSMILLVIGLLK